jgi:hypothetical protein
VKLTGCLGEIFVLLVEEAGLGLLAGGTMVLGWLVWRVSLLVGLLVVGTAIRVAD